MPEGHTIHRYARLHQQRFGGQDLRVSSPQGRFAGGAAQLDGKRLQRVEAVGKHLFYRWSGGDTLHIHLGLIGKFRVHGSDPLPPTPATRLAWSGLGGTLYLSGPMVCELVSPAEEETVRAKLGPDPLQRRPSFDEFRQALGRRSLPIGAALLDQSVIAGVGNVYRAEILFLCGIDPSTPAKDLTDDQTDCIWRTAVAQLRIGERRGRIVTVDPTDVGSPTAAKVPTGERVYAYKRAGEPCRRCGTEIERGALGNRKIWWCPTCQPESRR